MQNNSEITRKIKQDFFSYRNGIVADSLRKIYKPGKIIFGLTVPQFIEISKKYPKNTGIGIQLWQENSSREARLFALYIIEPAEIDLNTAIKMIKDVESNEEAEFLSFKILGRMPKAKILMEESIKENITNPHSLHCISMLKKNIERNS